MSKLRDGCLAALRWVVVTCLAAMTVLVFGNVVLRYGFNSGISFSEEAARYLFVWLTFSGAVIVMYDHGHLGVDTMVRRLPEAGQRLCAILCDLLMLGCCLMLFWGGWIQSLINWDNLSPVSGVPVALMHMAAVVSSVGLFVVILAHLLRVATGNLRDGDLIQVVDSEERAPVQKETAA